MSLQSSGPISLLNIQNEFKGSAPISISEYYGKGGVQSSGSISVGDFHGTYIDMILSHTVINPNAYSTSKDDRFGAVVSISGDKCIVGAKREDEAGATDSGKAYILNASTGALMHTLNNPNSISYDYFGESVSISGDKCIVGAPWISQGQGKAYIYNASTGALLHTLNNPNANTAGLDDYFGGSVAISGNRCIVGAENEDDAGTNSGKAYIFNVSTGALIHVLHNPNAYGTTTQDDFGKSVAISGDRCIISAFSEDANGASPAGMVYIFNVLTGTLTHTLHNPNAYGSAEFDWYSKSIAIYGDKCIIGAYGEDQPSYTDAGKAYVFNVSTGALLYTLNDPNGFHTPKNDYFGYSVSISNDKCIVGAYQEYHETGKYYSGKAYVFNSSTGALLYTLTNPNSYGTATDDRFSTDVGISGDRCIVGTPREDDTSGTESGNVYIYNEG